MAIHKTVKAALKALTLLDIDVKKTYLLERKIEALTAKLPGVLPDYQMWDRDIEVDNHKIPVRIFLPPLNQAKGVLLFFHGGGWVTGNIESYSKVCAHMAVATNQMVVSVDYRLAPEHRFPCGVEDCYAITQMVLDKGIRSFKPEDVTLIGDSAGGNISAVVSLMARDRKGLMPKRQILIYPATYNDHSAHSPFQSVIENGQDYLLTTKRIQHLMELYCRDEKDFYHPYFAPLLAESFENQPKTLIITAQYDPLRDEGAYYGQKLQEAGNTVSVYQMKDALHGFLSLPPQFPHVKEAYDVMNHFLYGVS